MVYSQLTHHTRYLALAPGLDKAFRYLREVADNPPADGRYEIDGEKVFAIVASYTTAPRIEKVYEGHYNYLDLQYLAQGGPEAVYYGNAETAPIAEDYDPARDFVRYGPESADSMVVLRKGDFAIFFPEDAHMPGVLFKEQAEVKKIVVKVKLSPQKA
ncbi:MAG TPA: YhcH/YjgK/YiaL family protein [archaeon]|nr:YhcH/YjgK/YiaL family protein [archaeon]